MGSKHDRLRRVGWLWVFAGAWAVVIVCGMRVLYAHQLTAGAPASAPGSWPVESGIIRDPARPTLVMLAHPRCPCTRASIGELAILMNRLKGRVSARVLFVELASAEGQWEASGLVKSAARIPGVSAIVDEGGREAEWFGARTSGQVLLYGVGGDLQFAGGITPGRAHMGDNTGFDRIVSLVSRGVSDQPWSSVFGCPLFDEVAP